MSLTGKPLIGLLGGTFNPIHNGHLHFAQSVLQQLDLDEVRFIPSAVPALKVLPQISAQTRAEMVKLVIASQPQFALDMRELRREGKSYTIDTLKSLRDELGVEVSLCWLIGTDAFAKLEAWHDWHHLFDYAHFVVVNRPGIQSPVLSKTLEEWVKPRLTTKPNELKRYSHGKVLTLEIQALPISSTEIRNKISQGENVQGLVPDAVIQYITKHGLYQ